MSSHDEHHHRAPADEPSEARTEAEMRVHATHDSLVTLLVEDNPDDAALLANRLSPSAHVASGLDVRLVHVTSADAAVAVLRNSAPQIIILDLSLPDADGLDALHRIRRAAPDVPIIVLTDAYDQASALDALRAGAQDYVLKPPPDAPTLHRILHYALQRQLLLQELDAAVRASTTAARRWQMLAEVGRMLAEPTSRGNAILQVVRLLVPTAADCVAIHLASDAKGLAVIEVAHVDEQCSSTVREAIGDMLSAPRARAIFEVAGNADAASDTVLDGALRVAISSFDTAAGAAAPIHFGGRLRGFLLMVASTERTDASVDDDFVRSLADRIALALEQGYITRHAQLLAAARDRAVGIVSHDLGNSLNTIQICAEALLDPDPPPESGVRNMAELIQRSVTWMRRIAGDLMDKTSLDTGLLTLDRRPTNVAELVGSAQAMFAPAAEERAIELEIQLAEELPPIEADPDRLIQVLANLVGNAIKFTPRGGRVVLSVRRVAGTIEVHETAATSASRPDEPSGVGVRFSVSDTGPGIRAEDLEHVFDWFWHAPSPRKGGKGLGLAIAKELVEAHRQSLHVESTLGKGSAFWFVMPAAAVAEQSSGARSNPENPS
ncbi:MAG: ATP-binding protein [Gemmatimonadota bacterium]